MIQKKKGYYENKESKKQYVKENMWKIERQFWPIRKQGTMQILKFTKKHQKSGTWNINKKKIYDKVEYFFPQVK